MSAPSSILLPPSSRCVVTGGAGFIGSHLVERLLADGHRVTVIDDLSTGRRENLAAVAVHPGLRFIESTVSGCAELGELVAGADQVFHLAAAVGVELVVREPIRVIETNLGETQALLEAAAVRRTPVVLASTSEVYGKSAKAEFAEEDDLLIGPPTHSRWSYACSKLMDEFLALAFAQERGLPVVIARLFNTVGPRQTGRYGMVLPRFIAAARRNEPLRVYGDGQQTRCFGFVQDTVEALVRLAATPAARGEVFNVGGTEEVTILELARRVIALLGSRSTIELVPYHEAYAPGFEDMRRRRPAVAKLSRVTGFTPATPLDEIIRRTAANG
ncbi:MAG: NAD-dependent epimerase/dehydratase family protein [Limisphaerales bacterium]